jgi:hypothetical protein
MEMANHWQTAYLIFWPPFVVVHYGGVTATPSMGTKSLEIANSLGYWSF